MDKGYRLSAATGLHKGDRDYQQDQVALLTHPRANGCVLAVVADVVRRRDDPDAVLRATLRSLSDAAG